MKQYSTPAERLRERQCRRCVYNGERRCGVPFCALPRCINDKVKRGKDEYGDKRPRNL